jgi:hypothetical protein
LSLLNLSISPISARRSMGGSVAFADPEAKLSIAVTLNKMQNEPAGTGRALEICDLIRNELDVARAAVHLLSTHVRPKHISSC